MPTVQINIPEKLQDFFKPLGTFRYRIARGGRSGGKSHAAAQALVIHGSENKLTILCCRETQTSIRNSVKKLIENKIVKSGLSGFYTILKDEIRGRNGTRFIFLGLYSNLEGIKSIEGIDIAYIEEANKTRQASIDMLIPTIRADNSEIWAVYNPDQSSDPLNAMFFESDIIPPRTSLMTIDYNDNPFLPKVMEEEMEWCKKRDYEKYLHIWGGGYNLNSDAQVFKNWRVGDASDFEVAEGEKLRYYYGADWGFAIDPTVLVRSFIKTKDKSTLYIENEVFKIGCDIDDTPALFDQVPESRKWKITADSARPETISYLRKKGFSIVGAKKGKDSIMDGIEFLKNFNIIVHPRCTHTIDELSHYRYKIDKITDEVLPVLIDDKNHIIDAMRYAVESTRRATGFFDA